MEIYKPSEQRGNKTSGLDMKETLAWYQGAGVNMLPIQEGDLPYPIENQSLIELSERELGGLWALFPENAQKRSALRKVVGQPSAWFHKDSTSGQPRPTTNEAEALSPTAIIPSYIDYTPWPKADIWLYKIPQQAAPEKVRRLVLAQGFVHEIGHSIVQPALYVKKDYNLKFPDGEIVSGLEAMGQFAKLAEQHLPISHYASNYRGTNNTFESDNPQYDKEIAISEEMCETIAAYFLGFAYCGDDTKGKNPFADRPEIRDFVRDFLDAELIKEEPST